MYSIPFNRQKFFALFVVFIFSANLFFAYALLPAQIAEARGGAVQTEDDSLIGIQQAWKAIDQVLQKITSSSSQTSAGVDMWSQSQTILRQATSWMVVQLLYKLLAMVSNDIIKWINGGQQAQFVTNWRQYLEGAAIQNGLNPIVDQYLGRGLMCPSYDAAVKQIFSAPLGLPTFGQSIACPTQSSTNEWDNWLNRIQPSGNFYGSYLQTLDRTLMDEEKARRDAEDEALSGNGYIGSKECKQWRIENLKDGSISMINGKSAGTLSADQKATCVNNQIITPPSLSQSLTAQTLGSGPQLLQQQIGAMTPFLSLAGINMAPFLTSLFSSLIHKLIGNGLSNLTGVGTTADDTYYYSQLNGAPNLFNLSNWSSGQTAEETTELLPLAIELLKRQRLLKESIENELMPQLTRQRDILAQMKQLQQNILTNSVEIAKNAPCALPTWASKQILNSQTNGDTTIQTIKVTAIGVGNITFTNTIASTTLGQIITVQITEANPEIADPDKDVTSAQQSLADVNAAIPATEAYIAAAEEYLDVYSKYASGIGGTVGHTTTGSNPEALQKIAEAESKMDAAWSAMIIAAQKVTGTSSTGLGSSFEAAEGNLIEDTTNVIMRIVKQAADIKSSLEDPESSINKQLADLQQKGTEIQTAINTCQQYLLQLQQQQQTTNPFRF
jgi:hypothetical protein